MISHPGNTVCVYFTRLIRGVAVRTGDLGACIHFKIAQEETCQVSMKIQLHAELQPPSDICTSSSGISEVRFP